MDVPQLTYRTTSSSRSFQIVSATGSALRLRAFVELSIGFALILLALWSDKFWQLLLGSGVFLWILFATLSTRPGAAELGLRISGMRRSLWIVAVATIATAGGVWISIRMHAFHAVFRNYAVEWGFLAYIVWALIQQFVLQDFFLQRLLRIFRTRTVAVLVAGLLFALAHIPNPLLVVATVIWGIAACALFLRYRNLYALGLAHAIFGMCLAVCVPNTVHHQMRVGIGYLRWHPAAPCQVHSPRHWRMSAAKA